MQNVATRAATARQSHRQTKRRWKDNAVADYEAATVDRGVSVRGQDIEWGSPGPVTTQTVTEGGKTTHRSGEELLELERGRGPACNVTRKRK